MKIQVVLSVLFHLLISSPGMTQNEGENAGKSSFYVEAGTGIRTGWWILHRGSESGSALNDLGLDNGHLSPIVPIEAVIGFRRGRFSFGLGADYTRFYDYSLRRQAYTSFLLDRSYGLADNSFGQAHVFLQPAWQLASHGRFALGLTGRLGWFHIWAFELDEEELYPTKERFFGQLGLNLVWEWDSGWGWYIRPLMHEGWMAIEDQGFDRPARHRMPSFGIHTGMTFFSAAGASSGRSPGSIRGSGTKESDK